MLHFEEQSPYQRKKLTEHFDFKSLVVIHLIEVKSRSVMALFAEDINMSQ